jgi:transposase
MSRKRVKYSDTFKTEAVKMVVDGSRPIAQVAVELDVNPGTLGVWVNKYRDAHPVEEDPLTPAERIRHIGNKRGLVGVRVRGRGTGALQV